MYYYTGKNVEEDPVQAVHYFQLAAGQGDMRAQCCLGICYYRVRQENVWI